jgi:hypothetical protein
VNDLSPADRSAAAPTDDAVFLSSSLDRFAAAYPEIPHKLGHGLGYHPLLTIDALARLGEALPPASVEYNRGDLPIGVAGKPAASGLTIGETIRGIESSGSWAALKNVEQVPAYAAILDALLDELRPGIEARSGAALKPQAYVFVSSPNAVTPYHFDPEHNILLQLRGTKVLTQFPAGDPRFAPDRTHESYHRGGGRELAWDEGFTALGRAFELSPGEAVYVPVMAPHHVRNGPEVSISLSITWRSAWSFAEADARAFNCALRRIGLDPRATGRWPARNAAKALAWRALGRLTRRR